MLSMVLKTPAWNGLRPRQHGGIFMPSCRERGEYNTLRGNKPAGFHAGFQLPVPSPRDGRPEKPKVEFMDNVIRYRTREQRKHERALEIVSLTPYHGLAGMIGTLGNFIEEEFRGSGRATQIVIALLAARTAIDRLLDEA